MVGNLDPEEIRYFAALAGFEITDTDLPEYERLVGAMAPLLDAFAGLTPAERAPVPAHRDPGRRGTPADDPLNAVIRWCDVHTGDEGTLSGKRFGLKDNIAVAGVPMTLASRMFETFIPSTDAVVVERILGAGGKVVAKLNMDGYAWSAGGESGDFGAILNPFDHTRTAAGSSGGSGAALSYDGIDVTLGVDQGGSIRLPASWCGTLGLKPTRGLVPYTGVVGMDRSLDYVGPLTNDATTMAEVMDVIAGPHWSDPRQCGHGADLDFAGACAAATTDLSGLRIGVVEEGFSWVDEEIVPDGTRETADATRAAIERFAALGATVESVSIPEHRTGSDLAYLVWLVEGQAATTRARGIDYGAAGWHDADVAVHLDRALAVDAESLPTTLKLVLTLGTYMKERFSGSWYAKARNLGREVTLAFDRALEDHDLLVMPTATHYAFEHQPDLGLADAVLRGLAMVGNTRTMDMTGHPALSIPAAEADGLPVGVMLIGRHFEDDRVVAAARSYELAHGWSPGR